MEGWQGLGRGKTRGKKQQQREETREKSLKKNQAKTSPARQRAGFFKTLSTAKGIKPEHPTVRGRRKKNLKGKGECVRKRRTGNTYIHPKKGAPGDAPRRN